MEFEPDKVWLYKIDGILENEINVAKMRQWY